MGLSIAVFVPEGVVIACDGLAEIHNNKNDQGFLHKMQKRLFVFNDRYLVNIHGDGFIKGLPCAYYVNKIFKKLMQKQYDNTECFSTDFNNEFKKHVDSDERQSFYVVGLEQVDADSVPFVLLNENGNNMRINYGNDNNIVYNYHTVGRSIWVNKLLLPTSYEISDSEKMDFESVDIDFSKYSIGDAVDFSKTFISLTKKLDELVQLKQMVGENITYGILTLDGKARLFEESHNSSFIL